VELETSGLAGTSVVALVVGNEVVVSSSGQRIGILASPGDAVVRACAARGWVHQGVLLTDGQGATVRLAGSRP
jgi:hypothetical protein